ncbi:MAG: amidase [Pseudomonadota bacterium]
MNLEEYAKLDATALAAGIRDGDVTAEEVAELAREALDKVDAKLNCRVRDVDEPPPSAADGPFAGVPFLIKDLVMHAAGVPQTMGSRLLAHDQFATEHSSELFKRFCAAGLTTIARTATPEFGFNGTTEPLANGPTRNPWDVDKSPGGSSGGSAAAVAAGATPMAHANDGGGSIRIPAAACGLVGLKPSRGRTPLGPDYQMPIFGMGVEFAVTRSVRDSAALLDCVAGPEANSFIPLAKPETPFAKSVAAPMAGLKIAVAPNGLTDGVAIEAPLSEEVRRIGKMLEGMGHHVEDVGEMPLPAERFHIANQRMWFSFCAAGVYGLGAALGVEPDDTMFEACSLRAAQVGARYSALQIEEALMIASVVAQQVGEFLAGYDAVILPPFANVAIPLGVLDQNHPDWTAEQFYENIFARFPCTAPFNMTGQPAISLPTGMHGATPLAVQVVGQAAREDVLLNIGAVLEAEIGWSERRPAVHVAN